MLPYRQRTGRDRQRCADARHLRLQLDPPGGGGGVSSRFLEECVEHVVLRGERLRGVELHFKLLSGMSSQVLTDPVAYRVIPGVFPLEGLQAAVL